MTEITEARLAEIEAFAQSLYGPPFSCRTGENAARETITDLIAALRSERAGNVRLD